MVRRPSYDKLLEGLAESVQHVPQFAAAMAALGSGGNILYVDSVNGSDTANDGASWDTAYATIATAVAAAEAGDTIFIRGSFSEAVTVSLAGLSIIGVGNSPKQAQWTGATDTVCLTIAAAYVRVENIYFKPPVYTASRATSAITLSSASYAQIRNCRFQGQTGSQIAIYSPVCNSDNVEISDCEFRYMNTATYGAAILGVEAGGLSYSAWKILRNVFNSCVIAIDINGRVCQVQGNTISYAGIAATGAGGNVLAKGIDLSGTSSYGNQVHGNYLGGTYSSGLYVVGATGDDWGGNFNIAGITAPTHRSMSLFSALIDAGIGVAETVASDTVTLTRGAKSVTCTAVRAWKPSEVLNDEGMSTAFAPYDYIVPASAYAGWKPAEPMTGDRITESLGTFEASPKDADSPVFMLRPDGRFRVHTKRVKS